MWLTVVELILAALLMWYLVVRQRRRLCNYFHERGWTGRAFDVTRVSRRVQRLRQDYLSEVQSHTQHTPRHGALLAMTRRAVGRLSYFRTETPESGAGEYDTETHVA